MKLLDWVIKRRNEPCALAPVYDGARNGVPAYPPNLSSRGMFINTPLNMSVGAVLTLNFRLAISNADVSVRGKVRHVVPGVGVGVEFVDLSPEARTAIERELDMADPFFSPRSRSGPLMPKTDDPVAARPVKQLSSVGDSSGETL